MSLDADVVILGGGCAGLSLAVALAERAPHLRVHTLEGRTAYHRDRTWCFWNTTEHPFEAAVTHRWSSWRVRHAGSTEARQRSTRYEYQHLPADGFYRLANDRLARAGQQLSMGVAVEQTECDADGGCRVETGQGALRCRWIFDSRPPAPAQVRPVLEQRFVGWHVRLREPGFDASVVDLMDFQQVSEEGRVLFFYVLPFSSTEALVEATFLDDPALPLADGEACLRAYLGRHCKGDYEVLYRESASLPMGGRTATAATRGCVVPIGTRGGRVKPSSGYAFMRIQRQSAALAEALGKGARLPRRFEPRRFSVLDRIFLRAVRSSPERAAAYFTALFARVPPDTLVRFLSETATATEILRVMLALPKADFLKAALPLPARERLA